MDVTPDQVRRALKSHHGALARCVTSAWATWMLQFVGALPDPSRRMRANVVYDLMINEARKEFDSVPDVNIVTSGNKILLAIGDEYIIRFKKLGVGLRSSNYPTRQATLFRSQLLIPGIPRGIRLEVGYKLDRSESEIDSVHVVYPAEIGNHWTYEIEISAPPMTLPAPPTEAQPRVRAKRTSQRRNAEDAS